MKEPPFEREPRSAAIIQFKDCDPFGLLYNVRYLDYILDARSEHLLKNYGFDFYRDMQKSNQTWVIHGHQIAYLEPARAHEEVAIRTRILDFTENLVLLEGMLLTHDEKRLKALQWTRMSYVALPRGNVLNHPAHITAFLESVRAEQDIPEQLDFGFRLNQLRGRFHAGRDR